MTPEVAALIVHFQRPDLTEAIVGDLLTLAPTRLAAIVVLDNGSPQPWQPPRSLVAAARHSQVDLRCVRCDHPGGFAMAVNAARRHTDAAVLALVNNDVRLIGDPFPALLTRMAAGASLVGPRVTFPDGRYQLSWGRDLSLAEERRERRRFHAQHRGEAGPLDRDVPDARPVDWVSGAFLCVDADAFDMVGGLDEGFTFYYEDVDFCRRLRAAGGAVWYEPAVQVQHALNATHTAVTTPGAGSAAPRLMRARAAGHVRYYARHHGTGSTLVIRGWESARALLSARRRPLRQTGGLLAAVWTASGAPASLTPRAAPAGHAVDAVVPAPTSSHPPRSA